MSKKIIFTTVITAGFAMIAFASCESVGIQQPTQRLTVVRSDVVTTVPTEEATMTTTENDRITICDGYVLQMGHEEETTTSVEVNSSETASQEVNANMSENNVTAETQVENITTYTIQSGDCLSIIAEKLNCDIYQLEAENPYLDWSLIQPGDQIVIPSGSYYESTTYTDYSDYDVTDDNWSGAYYQDPEYISSITLYSAPDAASWNNIEVSMSYLNGMTLAPGEWFDWNSYIGWATTDNSMGYQDAPVLVGTETGYATGGGVCVTSTALMQAARAAGMDIIEKHDHSRNVSYAQPGDEASVSYGSANLVFANTTGRTVTFYTSCSYGTVTVTCYAS